MKKRISFPAMGWSKIAFKALLNDIPDIEIIEPPDVTADILKIGVLNSPEFVCIPFKVVLGEFIDLIEKYDIHTFIMGADCGPCRFGFYAPVQERILRDMGYDVEIIPLQQGDLLDFQWVSVFERLNPQAKRWHKLAHVVKAIRRFYLKAKYIEKICRLEGYVRCRERNRGDTTRIVKNLMKMLDQEMSLHRLGKFEKIIAQEFQKIPIDFQKIPLRVTLSGEIHIYLDFYVNMDLFRRFGEEGVEIHHGLSLFDWINHKMGINIRRIELEQIAKPYIPMDMGGEAVWVMGEYIKTMREGFDGFVHLYPFTCMPESTCRAIIEAQSPEPFFLPIQFYSFDELSGYEGVRTRLEAFVDLLQSHRIHDPRFKDHYEMPLELQKLYRPIYKPEKGSINSTPSKHTPKKRINLLDIKNIRQKAWVGLYRILFEDSQNLK